MGTFAAARASLDALDLAGAVRERFEAGAPTLAICVGMQLLAGASEESAGSPGLDVLGGTATRFDGTERTPQMGWNRIEAPSDALWLRSGYAYFANTYALTDAPAGWRVAEANYGGPFIAAAERGACLACQFHPELSGEFGRALLGRWLTESERC